MSLLSSDEITRALAAMPGWQLADRAIRKVYTFASFPEAVAFVTRLVPDAEAANHHPDLAIAYTRVTVSYSTHSEGGVTALDLAGARAADACAGAAD
jgi:4a-hydroxytetrahydrobiopterin dehydratase